MQSIWTLLPSRAQHPLQGITHAVHVRGVARLHSLYYAPGTSMQHSVIMLCSRCPRLAALTDFL